MLAIWSLAGGEGHEQQWDASCLCEALAWGES